MKYKGILFVLISVVIIPTVLSGCVNGGNTTSTKEDVVFNDSTLERIVRNAINQPEGVITSEKLRELTRLELNGWFIQDISGLEYCTNLEYLDLSANKIRDISALARMTKMKELFLHNNSISDIIPLSSMMELEVLSLMSNPISDLSPLTGCTSITTLYLWDNQVASWR